MDSFDYPALEGGWGWWVVLSGFSIHVLTRGCLFSTGVLFSEWTAYFGKSKSETAWIGSIATGSALMFGPLASRLVEKWGYRKTAIIGGIISFTGLLVSTWANNVYTLYVTYGLIAGTGMGFSYLCGVVAVGEYFDKRRAIAFGIASSGSGFGAAIMAIFQEFLLDEYGWRGSMIILAGLSGLNQIVFGAMLRPLSSKINWKSRNRKIKLMKHLQQNAYLYHNGDAASEHRESVSITESQYDTPINSVNGLDKSVECNGIYTPKSPLPSRPRSCSMSPNFLLRRKQMMALQEKICDQNCPDFLSENHSRIDLYLEEELLQSVNASEGSINNKDPSNTDQLRITASDAVYLSNLSIASSRKVAQKITKSRANEWLDADTEEAERGGLSAQNPRFSDINNNRTTKVLCNPLCLIIMVNQFFTGLGIMIPFVHLSQKAILMGFSSREAAYLISFIGIGNIVGKVTLGAICDMKWANIFIVFTATQFGLATSVAMYPLASEYYVLVIASLLFGFCYGNYCGIPSLLTQYVGLNNLAEAIGYINFLEGAAGIIGPPLAGAIYDSSQSYNVAFAASAGVLYISLLVLFFKPIFNKRLTKCSSVLDRLASKSKDQKDEKFNFSKPSLNGNTETASLGGDNIEESTSDHR